MTNESKWLTLISTIVVTGIPLLVVYGFITAEQGDLWQTFALAIVAGIVAIVVPSLAKNYNDNAAFIQTVEMEQQTARLMAGLRE